MPGKHLDLDLRQDLGGSTPSDVYVPSQKAVKTYVDGQTTELNNKIESIEHIENLSELHDIQLTNLSNGQVLVYDETQNKWINNTAGSAEAEWGSIQGTLTNQQDLVDALELKADKSTLKTIATTGSYNDLEDKPSIPGVSDIYSETSTDAMSGIAVSAAISGKANSEDLADVATSGQYVDLIGTPELKAVATSGSYTDLTDIPTIPGVTDTYSATSSDAMSGKAVASAIEGKANTADLATVATSGDYNDLQNTPNIPTVSDNYDATSSNAMSGKAVANAISTKADEDHVHDYSEITNTPELATVAQTGSYTDLINKPSIPTVSDVYAADSTQAMSGIAVASALAGKPDSGDIYTKDDTYSKEEVNAIVGSVFKYAGSVATLEDLPQTATKGDVYNVEDTGANYAWNGTEWDKLSETIDLTPYLTKTEAGNTYAKTTDLKTVATSGSYNDLTDKPELKGVATSGSYNDLEDKPTIPTIVDTYSATSTNGMSGIAVAEAVSGKADTNSLHAVATSGDYEDLTNKPSIPTVTDTYSATSGNAMSGKAVASAISGKANTTDLDTKADKSGWTTSRAMATDANGALVATDVTSTELGYLDGVTSGIQAQLNAKASTTSPEFTGTPKAPTAAAGTNTTQLATTAFVTNAVSGKANTTHNQASNTINALTGFTPVTSVQTVAESDTLNQALAKIDYKASQSAAGGMIKISQLNGPRMTI